MCTFTFVKISHGAPRIAFIFNICCLPELEDTIAFTVALDDTYSPVTDEKIPYYNIITNIGSGYITQRNEFVCPQAGVYVFYAAVIAATETTCRLDFYKNDEEIGRVYSRDTAPPTSHGSNMFLLELQEADTVFLRAANDCIMSGGTNYCSFSGFKIN